MDSAIPDYSGREDDVISLYSDSVISMNDDSEVSGAEDHEQDQDEEEGGASDSSAFDFGSEEEDDDDYGFDEPVHSKPAAAATPVNDPLAAFRTEWTTSLNLESKTRSTRASSSPTVRNLLNNKDILRRIFSNPNLSHSDVRSIALASPVFLPVARSLLFATVRVDTPAQADRLLEALSTPDVALQLNHVILSVGDLDETLREQPIVRKSMEEQRHKQESVQTEYIWKDGKTVEAPPKWLESLRKEVGRKASAETFEATRRNGLFYRAVEQVSSKGRGNELESAAERRFRTYPFNAKLLDGVDVSSFAAKIDNYGLSSGRPHSRSRTVEPFSKGTTLVAPPYLFSFSSLLFNSPLASAHSLTLAFPMSNHAASLLPHLPPTTAIKELSILAQRTPQTSHPLQLQLWTTGSCELNVRTDGRGIHGVPLGIRSFTLHNSDLLVRRLKPGTEGLSEGEKSWELEELKLVRVGVKDGGWTDKTTKDEWEEVVKIDREGRVVGDRKSWTAEQSGAAATASTEEQSMQEDGSTDQNQETTEELEVVMSDLHLPSPTSLDLRLFVNNSRLVSLKLSNVDQLDLSSLWDLISSSSPTLAILHLSTLNCSTSSLVPPPPPPPSTPSTSLAKRAALVDETDPDAEYQILPYHSYTHRILPTTTLASILASPTSASGHAKDEARRWQEFARWSRWEGPFALPRSVAIDEQKRIWEEDWPREKQFEMIERPVGSVVQDETELGLARALEKCGRLKEVRLEDQTSVVKSDGAFGPEVGRALIRSGAELVKLEWRVSMVPFSKKEWEEWEEEVRVQLVDPTFARGGKNKKKSCRISVGVTGLKRQVPNRPPRELVAKEMRETLLHRLKERGVTGEGAERIIKGRLEEWNLGENEREARWLRAVDWEGAEGEERLEAMDVGEAEEEAEEEMEE